MVAFLAELAGFAIVSSVCHPAVALATYLAAACVSGIAAPEDKIFVCLQNLAFPNGAMLGNATRTRAGGWANWGSNGMCLGGNPNGRSCSFRNQPKQGSTQKSPLAQI